MFCFSGNYIKKAILLAIYIIFITVASEAYASASGHVATMRVALLGDSMTWIGGDSCENAYGWSHYLKGSGMAGDIRVYARSGATWTNTAATLPDTHFYSELLHDNNVIYNQVLRLINDADSDCYPDPDLILIFAGANDAWFHEKRPGIFKDTDSAIPMYDSSTPPSHVTSLSGSVSLVCRIIKDRFPNSTLIIVTPLEMSKVPADVTERVADIISQSARSCGAIVLNAGRDVDIRHDIEKKSPKYTTDGVHTNPEGACLLGAYIVNQLDNIVNQLEKIEIKSSHGIF